MLQLANREISATARVSLRHRNWFEEAINHRLDAQADKQSWRVTFRRIEKGLIEAKLGKDAVPQPDAFDQRRNGDRQVHVRGIAVLGPWAQAEQLCERLVRILNAVRTVCQLASSQPFQNFVVALCLLYTSPSPRDA